MPLKIIGAGYGRTGTLSTQTALNQLGFPCYHMMEVFAQKHVDFWCEVAAAPAGTQFDWERVFAHYKAAVDFPASCVWRELMVAYPDAKVLLTLHPKGAAGWYESALETIYSTETMWQSRLLTAVIPPMRKFGKMLSTLIWGRTLKGTMVDRARAIAQYDAHVAEVIASVPPDRLLVFSADQGWAPLCAFLGVPVPATPFPNVNDRVAMKTRLNGMRRLAYVLIAVTVVIVGAIVYGLARL